MTEPAPYDRVAETWSRARAGTAFAEKQYLDRFLELVPAGAHLLDLGCGCGRPIARHLLDGGYQVTGVDASARMLELARANCPEATFILGDMTAISMPGTYQGILAWDSVFHVPRAQHARLFQAMHGWLAPGAPLLLSVGGSADEFTAPMFGVDFFFSGHAPRTSVGLLRDAGFEILLWEVDDPSSRGHVAILGRKPGSGDSGGVAP